ncbi:MAG: polyhydroxybutyrate depolymerase [Deltaproteobacteria bacterium]|nr:polyhydroxybutyrate depolymerase [Deltaproteobacteria bacterium]
MRKSITSLVIALMLTSSLWACSSVDGGPRSTEERLPPGDHDLSLTVAGRERTYWLHIPPQRQADSPLPLVLMFHGAGGNGRGQEDWSGMDAVADREGFLVVYPDGTSLFGRRFLTWNAGGCCGYAMRNNVDDVGFVVALLKALARRVLVDRTRVYTTGMSNGAMMSYRLAVEIPERIAAITPVAGGLVTELPAASRAVPLLHIHSVDDARAVYGGDRGARLSFARRANHPAIEEVVAQWARLNGCETVPISEPTQHGMREGLDTTHTATKLTYPRCRDGIEVGLWKLTGAGHVWPGPGPRYPEWYLGSPTSVIDASEEMWRFFKKFSRADAPPLE